MIGPPDVASRFAVRMALIGAMVWLLVIYFWQPLPQGATWPSVLLLLAALVTVPLGLALLLREEADGAGTAEVDAVPTWFPDGALRPSAWYATGATLQPLAAIPLAAAIVADPTVPDTGWWTIPWAAVTAVVSIGGLVALWRDRASDLATIARDAAPVMLSIGGAWALMDGFSLRPLAFSEAIVRLTAVHFHYAAFALPIVVALAAIRLDRRWAPWVALWVALAVPLVAVGITVAQLGGPTWVEGVAALSMAASGVAGSALHIPLLLNVRKGSRWVRFAWLAGTLLVVTAMVLAAAYGGRTWWSGAAPAMPTMWAWHGSLAALGAGIFLPAGWWLLGLDAPAHDPSP